MSTKTIQLVTGATGFLGSQLVYALLAGGYTVAAVVRDNKTTTGENRLKQLLLEINPLAHQYFWNLLCLNGDITSSNLGSEWYQIGADTRIWHVAGDTRFSPVHREAIMKTNLGGTQNVLNFARQRKIRDFCYISTTYVAGSLNHLSEAAPVPSINHCRNPYEESKLLAETEVLGWSEEHTDNLYTIVRPAIVAGDSKTGFTSLFTGYYGYMEAWYHIKQGFAKLDEAGLAKRGIERRENGNIVLPIAVPGRADSPLSITTIDFVIQGLQALFELPTRNEVYHLCPPQPKTFGWWLEQSLAILGIEGVSIEEAPAINPNQPRYLQQLQHVIETGCLAYTPYISHEATFGHYNADELCTEPHPTIDAEFVHRLLTYAINDNFGKRIVTPVTETERSEVLLVA